MAYGAAQYGSLPYSTEQSAAIFISGAAVAVATDTGAVLQQVSIAGGAQAVAGIQGAVAEQVFVGGNAAAVSNLALTPNPIERTIRSCTRISSLFSSTASCTRLISACVTIKTSIN